MVNHKFSTKSVTSFSYQRGGNSAVAAARSRACSASQAGRRNICLEEGYLPHTAKSRRPWSDHPNLSREKHVLHIEH